LSPKQEAIQWLDHVATQQMLFSDKEVDRIRRKLARSTPEQAREWLEKTRTLRVALDSPRWQKTREWLRQFLEVQAIVTG